MPVPADFDPGRDEHVDLVAGPLLHRFRERDEPAAFALLAELAQPRCAAIARALVRRHGLAIDADDLVAGFFANLFTDLRKGLPPVKRFLGLARTAMRNDALNQLRHYKRAQARHEVFVRRHQPGPVADPAHELEEREQDARVRRLGTLFVSVVGQCFHELSERDRKVLLAREVDDLSYEAIAASLGLPRGQVGMILKRARERLATRVERVFARMGRPDVPGEVRARCRPRTGDDAGGGSPAPQPFPPSPTADASRRARRPPRRRGRTPGPDAP